MFRVTIACETQEDLAKALVLPVLRIDMVTDEDIKAAAKILLAQYNGARVGQILGVSQPTMSSWAREFRGELPSEETEEGENGSGNGGTEEIRIPDGA